MKKEEKTKKYNKNKNIKITSSKKKFNKLMIVAHPDDELIFGGAELIQNENYKIICMTNQDNPKRLKEFSGVINELNHGFDILNHKDDSRIKNIDREYSEYIENELIKKNIKKIVTHNKKGEYGHNFHRAVHDMVTDICDKNKLLDKLYYFHTGNKKIDEKLIKTKLDLMEKHYNSQYKVLARLNLQKDIENESLKKKTK
jgi:LmbE family N-acetylglucosaminyl deacetylase